jgi:probable RNA-binding protein EIF1AD
MPRPKYLDKATIMDAMNPPAELPEDQQIARVEKAAGNNLYSVILSNEPNPVTASDSPVLVEMPSKLRSTVWLKRGGYVLVELKQGKEGERENKIAGEIVNAVGDEKAWRKMAWWPKDFTKQRVNYGEDDGPTMPPSDDEEES